MLPVVWRLGWQYNVKWKEVGNDGSRGGLGERVGMECHSVKLSTDEFALGLFMTVVIISLPMSSTYITCLKELGGL